MRELEVAREAARAGGAILAGYFRQGIEMRAKQDCDFVSDADVESERAIVDVIRSTFPDHVIIGEEGQSAGAADVDPNSDFLWVIDPLDGTTNFAHDLPHFAVSIAFYQRSQPILGVIFNPARGDWFHAVRSEGAFANGVRVEVADHASLSETLVGVGFYYDRGAMMEATLASIRDLFQQKIHGIRRFGTASLDLCQVGCGQFGAFFEYELSPWDFAAGRLFVEEAGGRVTNCRGADLPLTKSSVLASNGKLHDAVLEIVQGNIPQQNWD
ncbi:MAG: inositol monophosphatase family protein [Planctomycetota bacterium]|nr:inositol monophosphatase family protein [Planctomycetota bacterium]